MLSPQTRTYNFYSFIPANHAYNNYTYIIHFDLFISYLFQTSIIIKMYERYLYDGASSLVVRVHLPYSYMRKTKYSFSIQPFFVVRKQFIYIYICSIRAI